MNEDLYGGNGTVYVLMLHVYLLGLLTLLQKGYFSVVKKWFIH